jgi:hypothetical protein
LIDERPRCLVLVIGKELSKKNDCFGERVEEENLKEAA